MTSIYGNIPLWKLVSEGIIQGKVQEFGKAAAAGDLEQINKLLEKANPTEISEMLKCREFTSYCPFTMAIRKGYQDIIDRLFPLIVAGNHYKMLEEGLLEAALVGSEIDMEIIWNAFPLKERGRMQLLETIPSSDLEYKEVYYTACSEGKANAVIKSLQLITSEDARQKLLSKSYISLLFENNFSPIIKIILACSNETTLAYLTKQVEEAPSYVNLQREWFLTYKNKDSELFKDIALYRSYIGPLFKVEGRADISNILSTALPQVLIQIVQQYYNTSCSEIMDVLLEKAVSAPRAFLQPRTIASSRESIIDGMFYSSYSFLKLDF